MVPVWIGHRHRVWAGWLVGWLDFNGAFKHNVGHIAPCRVWAWHSRRRTNLARLESWKL